MTDQIEHKCTVQYVMNVVKIAKCLLDQVAESRSIAATVLKEKVEMTEAVVEEMIEDLAEETLVVAVEIQEKLLCIVQYVTNVVKIVKYLLDQQVVNQFIVVIVLMVKMIKVKEEVVVEIIEIATVMAENNQVSNLKC